MFDSDRGGKEVNIYVMDTDGENVQQITQLEFASHPLWSPNGKQIAKVCSRRRGGVSKPPRCQNELTMRTLILMACLGLVASPFGDKIVFYLKKW